MIDCLLVIRLIIEFLPGESYQGEMEEVFFTEQPEEHMLPELCNIKAPVIIAALR